MAGAYSSGKYAHGFCDRCGQRVDHLNAMRQLVINLLPTSIRVCDECWEPDQPQLQLGRVQADDPQALRNARPDTTYYAPGNEGADGSRQIQWGWNPVGGAQAYGSELTPNELDMAVEMGDITVVIT
jgi:hypothetical protein